MKENDKINFFIQFLLKSGRFASQEDVGAFLGYPNKSSFYYECFLQQIFICFS